MTTQAAVQQHITDHVDRYVDDLKDLLRIPSVSAVPAHQDDMRRGAEFIRDQLAAAGLDAEIVPTDGYPIVVGEWTKASGKPTAVVYGHYDVQPPDPLDEWVTPPFEPDVRDGHVYARGATDDKGQMLTHIKSVQSWMAVHGGLPMNVKFVIEGEEEVGSDNLETFLAENRDRLKCDVAVISDTSQYAPSIPAITYGLRGILVCEFTVQGPSQDLHSGMFGGSIANPANAISKMIAALHDEQQCVQIPGFYDDVIALTASEREQFAALPFDEAAFVKSLGVSATHGEAGFSALERRWARPTCDVNGMWSGYLGEGPKTIVPAKATAKISCRLVPDQDPARLTESLREFLQSQLPPGLKMEFQAYHGCKALVFPPEGPFMAAAREAIEAAFGNPPVMIREGGSIPVVATFQEVLGVETLLLGWGQDTDNLHSPNERFSLADYEKGIRASAELWERLADNV